MFSAFFDMWETIKRDDIDEKVIIAFVYQDHIVLVQDDAIQAAQHLDEESNVVFCGVGCYWRFQRGHGAYYFRRLEMAGKKIQYLETPPNRSPLKAEKVRLPEDAVSVHREVDRRTNRVYIGRAFMGTFWWCPTTRAVYMRRHDNSWVGYFCQRFEWDGLHRRIEEQLLIPA